MGEVGQKRVYVDVASWVDEGASAALDEGVVALAGLVLRDLLHVGLPVNFSVWWGGRGEEVLVEARFHLLLSPVDCLHGTFLIMSVQRKASANSSGQRSHRGSRECEENANEYADLIMSMMAVDCRWEKLSESFSELLVRGLGLQLVV